jgi:hypothetical protein
MKINFSLLQDVQFEARALAASYLLCAEGSFPGVKWLRRAIYHSPRLD